MAEPTTPGATSDAILIRATREISEHGLRSFSFERFAEALSTEGVTLREHFADEGTLLRAASIRSFRNVGERVLSAVAAAPSGADALEAYVRAFVLYFYAHMDEYELSLVYRQIVGQERYAVDDAALKQQFIPVLNPPLDAVEAKLLADRGSYELPGGIHPRRLAFVAQIMAVGLLSAKAMTTRLGSPLKHGDDALLREAGRVLAGPIKALHQLSALNEATVELARLRDEASLRSAVPVLMARALGLEEPVFALSVAGGLDRSVPPEAERAFEQGVGRSAPRAVEDGGGIGLAAPVRYEGEVAGVIAGKRSATTETDERDLARLVAFASTVGLALENVRLYGDLQAQLEARTKRLTESQRRLAESEKLAALGKLVAGLVHELNTPLGAAQSSHATLVRAAEKVREKLGDEGANLAGLMARGAESASAALARVSDIVEQLKRFSRLDAAELEPLDVGTALHDAAAMLRHETAAGCDVRIEVEPGLRITCWASRVNQVFLHVLRNAVQAVGDAGTVRVSAVRGPASEVRVTVRDDGRGIPATDLPRIFEPGFTAKGGRVRAGLGLPTSYQTIADHGGEIRVESEVGTGTCVTIVLPGDGRYTAAR